jgi:hypothetical protein
MSEKNDFIDIINSTLNMINLHNSELKDFTGDYSFDAFIRKMVLGMSEDIEAAMDEREIKPDEEMPNRAFRYLNTVGYALNTKNPSYNMKEFLSSVNLILSNWMRMVNEGGMRSEFNLDEKDVEDIFNYIDDISSILKMSMSINRLVSMTDALIKKSEEVLSATPQAFNVSQHFLDAINKG